MEELIRNVKEVWPVGAYLLAILTAYYLVWRIAPASSWQDIENRLRNGLKLSLGMTGALIQPVPSVIFTIAYLRGERTDHCADLNRRMLDLYDTCIKHRYCFWCSEHMIPPLLVLLLLLTPLHLLSPGLAAAGIVVYFFLMVLAKTTARDLAKTLEESVESSAEQQRQCVAAKVSDYRELS